MRVFCMNIWIQHSNTIWYNFEIRIKFMMEINFGWKWSMGMFKFFLNSDKTAKIWWRFLSTVVFLVLFNSIFFYFLSKIVLTQIQILQVHKCENSMQYFNLIAWFFNSTWSKSANICDIMDSNKNQFKIRLVKKFFLHYHESFQRPKGGV